MKADRSTVLIIAESDDAHALLARDRLCVEQQRNAVIVDISSFPEHEEASFSFDSSSGEPTAAIGELNLADVSTVWWRRAGKCEVAREYYMFDVDFTQTECDHFVEGLLWATSCRWVNHPTDEILASRKVRQLAVAREVGLRVPPTVVTNSAACARRFLAECDGPIVTKRIGTARGLATETLLVARDDLNAFDRFESCPTLLQGYVAPGGDVRVVVMGTDIFAFWIESASGANPVDSRHDLSVEHRAIQLPVSVQEVIPTLFEKLRLSFGVLDFRVSQSGDYYFLEVNPSGQFGYLEAITGVPLFSHLARFLAHGST